MGLGLLLLAATLAVASFAEGPVLGLQPDEFAVVGGLGAIALVMAGWIVDGFRLRWSEGLRALVIWGAVYAGLVATYAHREEWSAVLDRMIGEVAPGRTVVTPGGEVVVARRVDGSFTLTGRINNREARFIFDTGASAVVLTAESAAASGFRPEALAYSVPVFTANGQTLAAPVTIDTLSVGPISERRVRALVARPGVLRENLLGMTFLERLPSYEVRGNRLILRSSRT